MPVAPDLALFWVGIIIGITLVALRERRLARRQAEACRALMPDNVIALAPRDQIADLVYEGMVARDRPVELAEVRRRKFHLVTGGPDSGAAA